MSLRHPHDYRTNNCTDLLGPLYFETLGFFWLLGFFPFFADINKQHCNECPHADSLSHRLNKFSLEENNSRNGIPGLKGPER